MTGKFDFSEKYRYQIRPNLYENYTNILSKNAPYYLGLTKMETSALIFKTPTSLVPPENLFHINFETLPSFCGYVYDSGKFFTHHLRWT